MKPANLYSTLVLVAAVFGACGAASRAQAPAAPTNDERLLSLTQTVARLENNLLSLAAAMPADKFDFAPGKDTFKAGSPAEFATVRTFAQQLNHISEEPYRQFAPFGVKPDTDIDPKSLDALTSKDDVVKALKDSIAYQNKVVASITPDNAFTPVGPRSATRISALIAILSDDGDHYGQMVEYLRMNGIIPPATENQLRHMSQPPQR